ncbi:AAA family ATPase [Chryseobacterium indoltheticum]|uniref:AAA domain-containing protein, putative AbiEii toxin, Type IV TA system n=1 Tax=Chryseobacterium indoltheticum TaxID=254 RepID=A0A381FBW1_9FLAO|nr:AAA family ATPase [Chryseobacterium indoltheticum]AZA73769.1 hypothetical protein EG358_08390 [Chryseobacterium indoltheticum]SIQ94550.1 AAA domain-containing protein, putative AbiEii toxin, Type IV TA system [Chryseobacterium indoltheticum]SUX43958.1 recombination protein F [Chryseobacterium indoltheticum]
MIKLKNLYIENFRHIEKQNLEFGQYMTIITGLNGSGKSSILGWIAQLCDYKGKDKTVLDSYYKESFRNVFRFCPMNDYNKEYDITFHYENPSESLLEEQKRIKTRHLKKTEISAERYRTDFDGRGKALDHPVIYLGLKRLIPLATENSISTLHLKNLEDYSKLYSSLIKEIFAVVGEHIKPEPIKSYNKKILALQTSEFSHLGNSAGQDNISQIISALISFDMLKKKLGAKFRGGILLIDELDATLYAAAQFKLVDILFRYAKKLDIQIVFTTHSLEILDYLESKLGSDTKINYFNIQNNKVVNLINPSAQYIRRKIKSEVAEEETIDKINFVCEDDVAEYWIKNLINGSDLKKMIKVEKGPFPDMTIVGMAESKHTIFKNVRFILDGDVKRKFTQKKAPNKAVFLPFEDRPETIFYEFVKNLSDTDEFWDDDKNFTKITSFKDYTNEGKGTHKNWFSDPINKKNFGTGYSKLLNRWKKDHPVEVENFINSLRKII